MGQLGRLGVMEVPCPTFVFSGKYPNVPPVLKKVSVGAREALSLAEVLSVSTKLLLWQLQEALSTSLRGLARVK